MIRFLVFVLLAAMTALGTQISSTPVPSDQAPSVAFNKEVLPILQNNCQTCHRPSGIAPMSLLTYESARPWAKAIKAAVVSKQMPPWFADPHYGQFRNAPKLTEADIHTLAAWVDSGAREGNPADKPTAIHWADGWRTKPDVVVSMRESFNVPAKGAGEIQSFMIPNPFKEDTWVTSIEIRPGDPNNPFSGAQVAAGWAIGGKTFLVLNAGFCSPSQSNQSARLTNAFGASLQFRFSPEWRSEASFEPVRSCGIASITQPPVSRQVGFDLFWERRY